MNTYKLIGCHIYQSKISKLIGDRQCYEYWDFQVITNLSSILLHVIFHISWGFPTTDFHISLLIRKTCLKTPWSVTFISLYGPPKFILMQPLFRLMVFSAAADTDLITGSEIALHSLPCRFLFSMVITQDSHLFNEILASAPQVDFIGG